MKRLFFSLLLAISSVAMSQTTDTYQVNGASYDLKTEVSGPLTLLWNVIDRDYRYFVKRDDSVIELVNTEINGSYQEEYKTTLKELTEDASISVEKVNLTLGSLRTFFNAYNKAVDTSYEANSFMTEPEYRIGGFAGVSNTIFSSNPSNASNAQFGIELEVLDPQSLPRHAAVVQYKQLLSSDEYDLSIAQFSINYRFKFVKSSKIDVFINTKLISYNLFNRGEQLVAQEGSEDLLSIDGNSGSSFQAPIIFGLGTDIKLGRGYLTLQYHDAVALFLENNGEFPVDVSLGYKIAL